MESVNTTTQAVATMPVTQWHRLGHRGTSVEHGSPKTDSPQGSRTRASPNPSTKQAASGAQ